MFKIMAFAAAIFITASSPVGSQSQPPWTNAVLSGGEGAAVPTGPSAALRQSAFVREDGVDRYGNDIGARDVGPRDYDACAALCAADTRCQAFTVYTPPPAEKGYCWLKHAIGPVRNDANSVTGVRLAPVSDATSLPSGSAPQSPSMGAQAEERWIFAVVGTGGFGWREPAAGMAPIAVETITRLSRPIPVAGQDARWALQTVRLDCIAQTATVIGGIAATEGGIRIVDMPTGQPLPINSDSTPQSAGMVLCNGATLPNARWAGNRQEVMDALRAGGAETAP